MLRVELIKQLVRIRSLVAFAVLAAVPIFFGIATAPDAGGQNGTQTGFYGAAPFSALNHVAATLDFSPLLLALVVALLGSAFGAADRDWGTLRYLYVQPVGRRRLLAGKWSALAVCCLLATACLVIAALIIGLIIFGWHPFHRIGAPNLPALDAAWRLLVAAGYLTVCMLSIGTIALALSLILPGAAEALGVSIAFVLIANILDGLPSLHVVTAALPMHYWQRWTALLEGGHSGLATGFAVQIATIVVSLAIASAILTRRDPAA
jgi:ABC-2 type transport system permease protein